MIATTCGCPNSYCLKCFLMVAASKNGLDEAPNTTLVILSMRSFTSLLVVLGTTEILQHPDLFLRVKSAEMVS